MWSGAAARRYRCRQTACEMPGVRVSRVCGRRPQYRFCRQRRLAYRSAVERRVPHGDGCRRSGGDRRRGSAADSQDSRATEAKDLVAGWQCVAIDPHRVRSHALTVRCHAAYPMKCPLLLAKKGAAGEAKEETCRGSLSKHGSSALKSPPSTLRCAHASIVRCRCGRTAAGLGVANLPGRPLYICKRATCNSPARGRAPAGRAGRSRARSPSGAILRIGRPQTRSRCAETSSESAQSVDPIVQHRSGSGAGWFARVRRSS